MLDIDAKFVKAAVLPGNAPRNLQRIDFAYPTANRPACVVNAVCGKNNSGKTHLLRRLREVLTDSTSHGAIPVGVELSEGRSPIVMFADRLWRDKVKAGTGAAGSSRGTPRDIPDIKTVATRLQYQLIAPHMNGGITLDDWENKQNRIGFYKSLKTKKSRDGIILRARGDHPVVEEIERTLGGLLYLRMDGAGRVDYALMQAERDVLPFELWSEGQKAVLAIVSLVSEMNPDIVIIDEIENHFHPAYMSGLMSWLKTKVPQTIIATHHPHIIFSEFVDQVVYLELSRSSLPHDPPSVNEYLKHDHSPAPRWSATSLADDFAKVAQSYKLFDHQDNRLLRQASVIQQQADLDLYEAVSSALQPPDVVSATRKPLPDRQTLNLFDLLPRVGGRGEPVLCLDLGAGFGRVANELRKLASKTGSLRWLCWEPDAKTRAKLHTDLEGHPFATAVELDDVPDGTVETAVIANVLHECVPPAAANLIHIAGCKLKPEGVVIVAELHPLLRAEKYAVPYSRQSIVDIFNEVGYHCRSRSHRVHSSQDDNAHYTVAVSSEESRRRTVDEITTIIEAEWERILDRAAKSYASLGRVSSLADYQATLQDLTTIASIHAYRANIWL